MTPDPAAPDSAAPDPAAPDPAAGRWQQVEALFEAALACDPPARAAYVGAAAPDAALRDDVLSLLAAHERPGAADRLAADLAPLAERVRGARLLAAPLVGRTVGRYRIVRPVGGGGMGVVYEAVDARLGRSVALKFLQPRLGADAAAAERFRREARAAAALEHPNVCTVHEIGEADDGQLFLAMPLYDGETLQHRLARGPLPVAEAVGIAVQVARGLAQVHARGLVHRDVKPSNVFVTRDGVVKLLDFGIATLADVTATGGGPVGTAAYMSPEQARGGPVDRRADLWSLGVVLYEMLAGHRPPAATGAPPARATPGPGVPRALERVVRTATADDPGARYASAEALEAALLAADVARADGARADGARADGAPWRRGGRAARRAVRGAVAALAVGVLAAAAWLGGARARRAAPDGGPVTVAVLPFADRSPAGGQEYFGDGMTEELIATLGRVDGLRVASRTSAFAYRDRGLDVRAVGRRLGVRSVLEGSVRRAGGRVRVTAQLVDVADGYQSWSDTYDRDARDAFAIQQEIARAIAGTLRARLVGGGRAPGDALDRAPDAGAYDLYLRGRHALYQRGRYAWHSRTEAGLRAAVRYFEQAVAQDPTYARAHAGLADAYAVLGFYDYLAPREAFPRAAAAARRAAALDRGLAAPQATLGYVALYHDWDFAGGERAFRRAVALEPTYATAHQWYGNLLAAAGRPAEAARAMRRAQEIDPLSLVAGAALGWALYHAGDHAAALAQLDATLELNADYALAHLWRGWALEGAGAPAAAVDAHRRGVAAADSGAVFVAALARSLALAGARGEAEALLRGLEARRARGEYVPAYEVAKVHDALGRPGEALAWLERAYADRAHSMVLLRVDPQLARLRAHPRFARLAARVFGGPRG